MRETAELVTHDDLMGTLVAGRYRFLKVLGRGGMGIVTQAHDTVLDRLVAVKMLAGDLETSADAQRVFLDEARALAPLSHPNLVAIHDIVEVHGRTLMVLEFVVGANLERRLEQRPLPPESVIRYGIQMARAAAFMHARGFIHRDLKPGNMIVSDDDQLKIVDFGLAGSLDRLNSEGPAMRGTPAYMAPEQVQGRELSPQVDTYQLGVTMFELLSGELPFRGGVRPPDTDTKPRSLLDVAPQVPSPLAAVVARCMASDPGERPRADELLSELQGLYLVAADQILEAIHDIERLSGEPIAACTRKMRDRLEGAGSEGEPPSDPYLIPAVVLVMLVLGGVVAYLAVRVTAPDRPQTSATVSAP